MLSRSWEIGAELYSEDVGSRVAKPKEMREVCLLVCLFVFSMGAVLSYLGFDYMTRALEDRASMLLGQLSEA